MKYKIQEKISNSVFKNSNIKEEQLMREIAHKLIEGIQIEHVKKMFNIEIIYGNEESLIKAGENNDIELSREIEHLMHYDQSLIKGSLVIKD